MNLVLLLTGTCGSGKSTVARLIALRAGWEHVSEDDLWRARFHKNRGLIGTQEHRRKRHQIQTEVVARAEAGLSSGKSLVVDATIHESRPEAFHEYRALFEARGIPWSIRVLHPRLEVAIARDAERDGWRAGAEGVAELHAKFTGAVFRKSWFLDTSEESARETMERVLASGLLVSGSGE